MVVYIGTLAIGLTLIGLSEEVEAESVKGEHVRLGEYSPPKRRRYGANYDRTTKPDFATSRLRLQAYSPYCPAEIKWLPDCRTTN